MNKERKNNHKKVQVQTTNRENAYSCQQETMCSPCESQLTWNCSIFINVDNPFFSSHRLKSSTVIKLSNLPYVAFTISRRQLETFPEQQFYPIPINKSYICSKHKSHKWFINMHVCTHKSSLLLPILKYNASVAFAIII